MEEYRIEYDPKVCPSSLMEDEESGELRPITEGETAHKWDKDAYPISCAECGAEKDGKLRFETVEQLTKVVLERFKIQVESGDMKNGAEPYSASELLAFAIEEAWQNDELEFLLAKE